MGQSADLLSHRQAQTRPARDALNSKFSTPIEKSDHFRGLARKSHERRITLSGDEAVALVDAYTLLTRIAERARMKLGDTPNEAA